MKILLNGQPVETLPWPSLDQFLQQQSNLPEQFAIAINSAFVPQPLYPTTMLEAGDDIELLVAMQGG